MKLIINKDRSVIQVGTWGTVNENDYEILDFEFPAELEEYNKRIVYYLDDERVWDAIVNNKAYITNAITTKGDVKAYVWCTKENTEREADTDFRTMLFDMHFYENENADGIVPTEQQVDGFNTMLTAMNAKIDEVDALETTIGAAESTRQTNETTRQTNEQTRQTNEATRQSNEQTRQEQEAERERKTAEAIADIEDKTAEYNANAEAKTNEFNDLVDVQKLSIEKYGETQLNAIGRKSQQALGSITTTTQFALQNISLAQQTGVSAVETASSEATTNFNTNATNKTNAFNSNATEKTTTFDNNASTKTSEFNTNAESKTSAFNDNATQKTTNFDNNASEKTDEFNTNAQEKIDEYDEHTAEITADIEELQQEVEELSENMPWNTTEQATEIQVTDAAKYSKNKMKVFGNTEQAQYSGKNLLNIADTQYTWNDISVEISNGIITLNGTPSVNSTNKNFASYTATEDGIYTLLPFKSSTNNNIRLLYSINGGSQQNSDNTPNINLTTGDVLSINLRVSTTDSISSFVLKPMLYKGSEATDYEPYVGGPSPNPDYPQPIHVVSGENTIGVNSKNFYDATQSQQTRNNLTYSADNQYIYLDGKASNGFNCDFKHFLIPKGTYTMMFELKEGSIDTTNDGGLFYVYGSVSTSAQKITNTNKRRAVTFTLNTDGFVYVHVWPRSSETFSNARIAYQLVKGNVADYNFASYYHADYPINLGNIELCKIGNYQDYLYKENGNWYKYGAVKKTIFNGTENWRQSGVASAVHNINLDDMLPVANNSTAYNNGTSDQFKNGATYQQLTVGTYSNYYNRMSATNDKYMSFSYEFTTTTASWKEWLTTHNLTAYYVLETATTTQITDETLIAQLEAIYNHLALVKGTNHIAITPSDLAPYVTLNYMQDLPSKLDNLDSRLALLE